MEVVLTFGSLGDIIVVCQLAIQLSRAIKDNLGHGSAKKFHRLRKELGLFVKVCEPSIPGSAQTHNADNGISQKVVATYSQHEFTLYLEELDTATLVVVNECGDLIQEALDRWHKYHEALSSEGSGNGLKSIVKKIEWSLRDQKRMKELQKKLDQGVQRLTLLGALAAR
ncbi:hypothetical protein N0V88_006704 [Collariella sp. IMI 366227]|nr:hypothetical protein N0V88_006704 [Collariella sp. IMI 366227]